MRKILPAALLAMVLLSAAVALATQAQAAGDKKPAQNPTQQKADAAACKEFPNTLKKAAPEARISVVLTGAHDLCPAAESVAVQLIESGRWPDGTAVPLRDGAQLIQSLRPSLTPYRVHLLLDVYEQVAEPGVREAVLLALNGSKMDEALLPALECYWEAVARLHETAATVVSMQPEASAPAVLARLIRKLPEGPLLTWAVRLADKHPSEVVTAARAARGLK